MTSLSKDESENYAEAGGVAEEVLSSVRTVVAFGGQEKEVSQWSGSHNTDLCFVNVSNMLRAPFSTCLLNHL